MSKWQNLTQGELTVPEKEYFQEKSKDGCMKRRMGTSALLVGIRIVTFY